MPPVRTFLWIIFFGSLIGLNETLIGNFSIPYRAVVLSAVSISLLTFGRYKIPKSGASILMIAVAILFKLNSHGVQSCTVNMLLCGPLALFLLGTSHELFASLFLAKNSTRFSAYVLTCSGTAILAFSLFGIFDTFILKVWDVREFTMYISFKSVLTAITSSSVCIFGLYLARFFKKGNLLRLKPFALNGILSALIIALWIFGSFVKI